MIGREEILSQCPCAALVQGDDDAALAQGVEGALGIHVDVLSVAAPLVQRVWPWVEGRGVTLFARLQVGGRYAPSELARDVRDALNHGADGAIIGMPRRSLEAFANDMCRVRNDLFFNKKLSVALDVDTVDFPDWPAVFQALCQVNADNLMLVHTNDAGDASDFVGRLYGLMTAWDRDAFAGAVHFSLGDNWLRTLQAARLVQKMRPELMAACRFFIPF